MQEASIHTKRLGKSDNMTSWTWVHFAEPPTDKEITAGMRATDGDYTLSDTTLIIKHRAIPTEQRTRNIVMFLRRSNVNVTVVVHHGQLLKMEEK